MEQATAAAFSNVVLGRVILELEKNYKLWRDVKEECELLRDELVTLAAAMDDDLKNWRDARRTAVAREHSRATRELTHDIEDCIERFLHRVTCMEGASRVRRAVHTVKTLPTCLRFATRIKKLKKRLKDTKDGLKDQLPGSGPSSIATTSPAEPGPYHFAGELHGIEEPKQKILSLLEKKGDEPDRLRVIAIVGFGGSGKTALATAVFNQAAGTFDCRAFVGRGEYQDAGGLLKSIIKKVVTQEDVTQESNERSLANYLKNHLNGKRYLIVIDDVDMAHWGIITSTFEDGRKGSRIIVTTTSQSEANTCCTQLGKGYVHKMSILGRADSMRIALPNEPPDELVRGSESLLKKCDGLPLALVSVARQLSSENEPTGQFCAQLCRDLGSYLVRPEDEHNFARLRGVLMNNYASLSNHTVRTCLLYLSIFPIDRPPRMKVVMRRWLAEGYARSEFLERDPKVTTENLDTFINRNIIQPVLKSTNTHAKTCRAHGIVHEFLLRMSMSEKFIVPFCSPSRKKVRHLFVHDNNGTNSAMNLSCVRSLTVSGSAGDAISDFGKYKLMRVLDLEECSDVNDGHLRGICKLWNLRYLSLGPNITMLPREIAKLKLLETLDVSKTSVNVLPVEVIGLRFLVNLIGKFKLPDQDGAVSRELEKLSKGSNLETLAGFVASDQSQVFRQLMVHMKKLRKVKIWCESNGGSGSHPTDNLSSAIKEYMKAHMNYGDVRSLSIDFEQCSEQLQNFLHSLEAPCYLSSLKLHGRLPTLPPFVASAKDLIELCLSSTTLTSGVLSAVSNLPNLLYLKLIADHLEKFVIRDGKFRSLRRLRFVVRGLNPILPEILEGALPELVSLQLHCEHLAGLAGNGIVIRRLTKLKEIDLGHAVRVTRQTRREWEDEARNHPNRPDVLPIERVDDTMDDEPTEKSVAPDEPAPDQSVEAGLEQSPVQTEQGNSTEQSSQGDILTPTNNSAGLSDDSTDHSEPPENSVALKASTHEIGIHQPLVKAAS